ncbi:GFA family protein [Sinorhizobium sp. BG8]|uniref:GFA family protein n=1 Tax=Sinorhizobium sp. BG8 TaxID=2613773 RepID=UPI00193D8475|nr:GFA family protein [Sinorhizobium sp. BG8]QRM54847.1 GFA family protein [Sinorhizobium sp. BG8]
MSIARIYTGGCQCGAVRYRAEGTLGDPHLCHCRMCQKAAGNYFMPLANASRATLTITRGEPAWFSSSAVARRGFCRDCGTPLFYDMPGETFINLVLGSLDDPEDVRPLAQSSVESRMPWFTHLAELPESETDIASDEGAERHMAILESNRQHPDYDTDHWPLED